MYSPARIDQFFLARAIGHVSNDRAEGALCRVRIERSSGGAHMENIRRTKAKLKVPVMCNDYRLNVEIASILEDFDNLEINIETPEGVPEVEARANIRMTDVAPIVRAAHHSPGNYRAVGEMVMRRWSWPGKRGPVYNFRTEGFGGRAPDLSGNRCLVLCNGFYEFTDPAVPRPKDKRLDKWLFTLRDHRWFCMAGIWRADPEVGEAFSLLTMDAGADIEPYHNRQIIPLMRGQWADWLDTAIPAEAILKYLPAGMLQVTQVYPLPPRDADQATLAL